MDVSSNDNNAGYSERNTVDPNGHAALLLLESLLLSLVDGSVINATEADNIVSIAIDATDELAKDSGQQLEVMQRSISLLSEIRRSLAIVG